MYVCVVVLGKDPTCEFFCVAHIDALARQKRVKCGMEHEESVMRLRDIVERDDAAACAELFMPARRDATTVALRVALAEWPLAHLRQLLGLLGGCRLMVRPSIIGVVDAVIEQELTRVCLHGSDADWENVLVACIECATNTTVVWWVNQAGARAEAKAKAEQHGHVLRRVAVRVAACVAASRVHASLTQEAWLQRHMITFVETWDVQKKVFHGHVLAALWRIPSCVALLPWAQLLRPRPRHGLPPNINSDHERLQTECAAHILEGTWARRRDAMCAWRRVRFKGWKKT